jgi:hypothetical protein
MPEAVMIPVGEEGLALQRAMLQLALNPGPDEAWPSPEPAIPPAHAEAFRAFRPRLLAYRELVRASLWDPVDAVFPMARALVGGAAWPACREAFLAAGSVRSRHYRDIPVAFVEWLAATGWGAKAWPALLSLAHYELVEVLVSLAPDPGAIPGLASEPSADRTLRLHPAAHLLTYPFAVHRATVERPRPAPGPTHLLAYRDSQDAYRLLELTAATSALLARAQQEPLGSALRALGITDSAAGFDLITGLCERGAILGFEP